MNDIKMSAGLALDQSAKAANAAGDKPTGIAPSGESLPLKAAKVADAAEASQMEVPASAVNTAVAELNDYVQSEKRDLLFSIEDASGDMVVRVVDRDSGELIRQIPHQVVLDLAAKVKQNEPLQLINMQG